MVLKLKCTLATQWNCLFKTISVRTLKLCFNAEVRKDKKSFFNLFNLDLRFLLLGIVT